MIPRLVLDTSAAVDYLRKSRNSPPQVDAAEEVLLPLTVVGELFYGAERSDEPRHNQSAIHDLLATAWTPLLPDVTTAVIYGEVRASASKATASLTASKVNDLWIAALCIQHDLPLLTNDGGFDHIPGLRVLHW